jgi:cytochrome c peroxidase
MSKKIIGYLAALTLVVAAGSALAADLTPKQKLGKNLFFDMRLSNPAGQSCGSCHNPGSGFSGTGDANIPVQEGAVKGKFGNRKPPQASYASFSPEFGWDGEMFIGGVFWDGRVDNVAEQAGKPFLNPLEQNNKSKGEVVAKVAFSNYVDLFIKVYGAKTLLNVDKAFNAITDAIAAYEKSAEVNKFSSKYDWYLQDPVNNKLSALEERGRILFNGSNNNDGKIERGEGAGCSACHPSESPDGKPLFTDFSYDNIGIPCNPDVTCDPLKADLGLGAPGANPKVSNYVAEEGKFKVSTLRNIAVAPPFGHNGYFKTLKEITHFYNTRGTPAVPGDNWPLPQVNNDNVNNDELGALGLNSEQEDAVVAFMMTLTDGYAPPNPR